MTKEEGNAALAELLNEPVKAAAYSGGPICFSVDSPVKLTTYRTNVGFRKEPFIGEENLNLLRFQLSDKRKDLVAVFFEPGQACEVHTSISEAKEHVIGFTDWYEDVLLRAEVKSTDDAVRLAKDKRVGFAEDSAQCPEWGIW